jgi:hypothetical protein
MSYRRVPTNEEKSLNSQAVELEETRVNIPPSSSDSDHKLCLTLLCVGSSSSSASLQVSLNSSQTLHQIKLSLFPDEVASGRLIRFIYSGRVLFDEFQCLKDLGIETNSCLHVHIISQDKEEDRENKENSNQTNQSSHSSSSSSSPSSSVSRRSFSHFPSFIDESNEIILIDSEDPGTSWRLANSSSDAPLAVPSAYPPVNERDDRNRLAASESQENGQQEEFNRLWHQARIEGGARDLIVGFILGSFLGILAVIWLWHSGSTRKMRIGILIGISTSFLGTYFRIGSEEQKKVASNRPSEEDPDPLQPLPIR